MYIQYSHFRGAVFEQNTVVTQRRLYYRVWGKTYLGWEQLSFWKKER
jgi:hypothetical protein